MKSVFVGLITFAILTALVWYAGVDLSQRSAGNAIFLSWVVGSSLVAGIFGG